MKVQDCIFFQMIKASKAAAEFWAHQVEHLGITASQAMVLNFLSEEDCIPSHLLGQKLQITSATTTGILDRLEKMNLIERRPHPEDRRAILVCLTRQGGKNAREINKIMVEANREFLGRYNSADTEIFRDLLRRVNAE